MSPRNPLIGLITIKTCRIPLHHKLPDFDTLPDSDPGAFGYNFSLSSSSLTTRLPSPSLEDPTASPDYYPDKLGRLPLAGYLGGAKGKRGTLTSIGCRSDQH